MKKIYTLSALFFLGAILLAGCVKRDYGYEDNNNYWYSRESGEVVYADTYCPYYVVETANGYTIIRATSGYTPYEGSVIYGDLSRRGYMDLLNDSDGTIIRGEVTDYWLSYADAQYLIDNLCYSYSGKSGPKKIGAATKLSIPATK